MNTYSITLVFFLVISFSWSQSHYNLDFEELSNEKSKDWGQFGDGNHKISFERKNAYSGNICGVIESTRGSEGFKALAYTIPADFGGKKVKLAGYLKTENVEGGFAGLWLRVDPNISFDNMATQQIQGTNDWQRYEIELDYNSSATNIVLGGLLVGKGKIWVDNFELTIDGKPLNQAPEKELSKAQKDTEFDSGSSLTFPVLDTITISNLDLLGRIWGFLKYHHPAIATGDYNWDYELFRILPKFLEVTTETERDEVLVNWIKKYGEVEPCKSCKEPSKDAFLKPDLNWMTRDDLSSALKSALMMVYNGRHQGDHYYIGTFMGTGNADFKNEDAYADMPFPDAGFRLLCLYRYWNMIQYYFPYKHLIDKDWNTTLTEYIPRFLNARNELEYEIAALQIIGDIKDTHANLWGGNDKIQEQRGDLYPPVHVRFVENQLVVDDYFEDEKSKASGLQIGDVITHVNGTPVKSIVENRSPYYPASNQPTRLRDISFDILRSNQKTIELKIKRDEETLDKIVSLYPLKEIDGFYRWFKDRSEPSFKRLNEDIGYVTLQNIKDEDIELLRKEFEGTKGIIVDIRNYPSTFVPFKLGNYLNSNRTDFVKFTRVNPVNPGEFTFDKGLKVGLKRSWSYKGQKVVVLVNELSQSQAEYTAMAFRAGDKTTIIGSTTAGADGNVSRIVLPGGMRTMISGIGVYYPDGTETQRVGIVPDIEVKPTIEGIKNGRDEVLDKAVELIKNTPSDNLEVKN